MQILVVDPNVAFATLLSEELSRQGYGVNACTSGTEALAIAQQRSPDLAILDMALTDPDALELARILRVASPSLKLMLIPLIGDQLSAEARALSIQGILPKPFFLPELPERITAALGLDGAQVAGVNAVAEPAPSMPAPAATERAGGAAVAPARAAMARATPVPQAAPAAPAPKRVSPVAQPAVPTGEFSLLAFRSHRERVEVAMFELSQEVGADAVLLVYDAGLLTWVGELEQDEAESISEAVIHGWRTSAEVARILGREQLRFEQSLGGGSYMLYALGVNALAILAVAVRGTAPLGLLRHQARVTADTIATLCSG